MRKILLSVMMLCCGLGVMAQNKLDVYGQDLVRRYQLQMSGNSIRTYSVGDTTSTTDVPKYVTALVALADGATAAGLEEMGAVVHSQRANIVIATLPVKDLEGFSRLSMVKKVSVGGKAQIKLNTGRTATGVTSVHSGIGLERRYTGSGVVTGLMDTGLDPNHVAFLGVTGEPRVKRLWTLVTAADSTVTVTTYDTPSAISSFTTENNGATHGTHVAGIMAGGYTSNDFYGVATGSDIAMACGSLENACILQGVENIIAYAQSEGKPAVVNLSLGINSGPHDGKDLFNIYLNELAKDAIICVSAGNEGMYPIAVNKTFTATDKQLKTLVVENASERGIYGTYEFWSNSDKPFSFTPVIFDKSKGEIIYSATTITAPTAPIYASSKLYAAEGDLTSSQIDKAFTGYWGYASEVDTINNRYTAYVFANLTESMLNSMGNYVFGFIIEGSEGQRIDGYCDGNYTEFTNYGIAGWDDGMTDGTINNMACCEDVIAVGAFASRVSSKSLSGQYDLYYPDLNAVEGGILEFSSYHSLYDGRKLPHVCAPGLLVSSVNTYYVQTQLAQGNTQEEYFGAKVTSNGRDHYWEMDLGTSMASPFVAGVVALWLEANPDLTATDVQQIIAETSTKDIYVTGDTIPVRWGAGKINAVEGLKMALTHVGIESVDVERDNKLVVSQPSDSELEAFVAGEASLSATLYNMSGQPVASATTQDDTVTVNVGNLSKGIYILSVKGEKAQYSTRVVVK